MWQMNRCFKKDSQLAFLPEVFSSPGIVFVGSRDEQDVDDQVDPDNHGNGRQVLLEVHVDRISGELSELHPEVNAFLSLEPTVTAMRESLAVIIR